jgi:hypothetical protein
MTTPAYNSSSKAKFIGNDHFKIFQQYITDQNSYGVSLQWFTRPDENGYDVDELLQDQVVFSFTGLAHAQHLPWHAVQQPVQQHNKPENPAPLHNAPDSPGVCT